MGNVDRSESLDPHPADTEVGTVPASRPRRSYAWLGIAGWVAAAGMAVAVGTFWETILRLRHEIRMRDERVAELEHRTVRDQRWITVLSAPGARVAELTAAPSAGTAFRGRALYDPASQRALVVFEEAVPPGGQDYQLWAVRGGAAIDLGILRPDSTGFAIYRLENMGAPGVTESFFVTREPKGGSPRPGFPTGPVVLTGPLAG